MFLKYEEIQDIFRNHLKIESNSMSIDTLFANVRRRQKINPAPYYQRNYVWDESKASYFIESIMMGTEIPPLIFFNSGTSIEVIDGRQRFETISRFLNDEFFLSAAGLCRLQHLAKKKFEHLDQYVQDIIWDTKLRIIEFAVINEPRLDDRREDMIKKEIFRRYNSGITPLKTAEIEKAEFINDPITSQFRERLSKDRMTYASVVDVFLSTKDGEKIDDPSTLSKVLQKLRNLLVSSEMPILSTRNKHTLTKFYDNFTQQVTDLEKMYQSFLKNMKLVVKVKEECASNQLSPTRLFFETLYWGVSILEKERYEPSSLIAEPILPKLIEFIRCNQHLFFLKESHFYKQFIHRYNAVGDLLNEHFGFDCTIYISSNSEFRKKLKDISGDDKDDEFTNLESIRLNKPDASSITIDDICRQMMRNRFLIRPAYQRGEVINRSKSSAIIESILLGIKLPPVFIFKREDGISEVIDGQQRLLSIIGFIGANYMDENKKLCKSSKHKFKLADLRILSNLKGKQFSNLTEDQQGKIYDYHISVVTIDEKVNPSFDPVDLFVRLNNKPYPVKENSFEMWNSCADKQLIAEIKELVAKYGGWFYLSKKDIRMETEELYTCLSYFDYKASRASDLSGFLDIYYKGSGVNARIKSKDEITKTLSDASTIEAERQELMQSIRNIDAFIRRLRTILIDKDIDDGNSYLDREVDQLFNITKERYYRRTFQDFYLLWFILRTLDTASATKHREAIKNDLVDLQQFIKSSIPSMAEEGKVIDSFYEKVNSFQVKYSTDRRKIKLTKNEKEVLIRMQKNLCPICGSHLFVGDEVEVDHNIPIANGGKDRYLNLQVVHKHCNRTKGKNRDFTI